MSIDSVMSLIIIIADPKNSKVVYLCSFIGHDNIKKTLSVLFAIGTIIHMSFLAKQSTIKKNIFWHRAFWIRDHLLKLLTNLSHWISWSANQFSWIYVLFFLIIKRFSIKQFFCLPRPIFKDTNFSIFLV